MVLPAGKGREWASEMSLGRTFLGSIPSTLHFLGSLEIKQCKTHPLRRWGQTHGIQEKFWRRGY